MLHNCLSLCTNIFTWVCSTSIGDVGFQNFILIGLNGYRIDGNDDVDKTVQQYYVNLVKFLPMDDPLFRAELCSVGLLPRNLKSEISSKPTSADKAEHFLDNGIKSNSSSFWKLVKVMKNTNDDNVQQLAVQIELHYKSGNLLYSVNNYV